MFRVFLSLIAAAVLVTAVPAVSSAQQPKAGGSTAKKAVAGVININTAAVAELQQLPGIGAKTAARIIEYRQKNGPFKKIEQLMNVRGIGEKNFLKLKPQITIGETKTDHPND